MLIAVAARRHPLVDAVQTSCLLEALDLVLWVEALNSCQSKQNNQNRQNATTNVSASVDASKLLMVLNSSFKRSATTLGYKSVILRINATIYI